MLLLITMLLAVTVGLAVVGHLSAPATQRKEWSSWTMRDLLATAYRGNDTLAEGPRYQYDHIARTAPTFR